MNRKKSNVDLLKLAFYILKRAWLVVICAAVGFGILYYRSSKVPNTYTASGTMFVTNSNPNLVNYGYASTGDFNSAVALVNVYSEVIKSEAVMQKVLEYRVGTKEVDGVKQDVLLSQKYRGLTTSNTRNWIRMESVNETPMVRVSCRTAIPELSADLCNAVLQVAPAALKDVVGAGDAKPQDFAKVPTRPDGRNDRNRGLVGAVAGAAVAAALLALLYILNQRVEEPKELTENYAPPLLASVRRKPGKEENTDQYLLGKDSDMDVEESYAKLRMNLLYTLVGKDRRTVLVTSAISGEGKSTITANLAISLAMSGKKVLLMDADMRRACQNDIFHFDGKAAGLSNILVGTSTPEEAIHTGLRENLDVMPAGAAPPNPSELLESAAMRDLLKTLEAKYDLVLLDAPPINIVSDPLALSGLAAGGLFVVRQHFSDHREIRRALEAAELTGLEILGFIFYGEKLRQGSYYSRRYYRYKGYYYYHKYDTRGRYGRKPEENNKAPDPAQSAPKESDKP